MKPNRFFSLVILLGAVLSAGFTAQAQSNPGIVQWGSFNEDLEVPDDLDDVVQVAVSHDFAVALKEDGSVVAWGNNVEGQTDVPHFGVFPTRQVAVGRGRHALAIGGFTGGSVFVWGNQTDVPPGLNDAVQVAGGLNFSVAVRANGGVVAWGNNNHGQTNVPAGLSGIVHVAAGRDFVLAVRADGTVVGWGRNDHGQLDVPVDLRDVVQVAAGNTFSVALKSDGTLVTWGEYPFLLPEGLTDVV